MEDYQELLLKSLKNAGVSFPSNVCAVGDLNPESLVSICAQSLNLLDPTTVSLTSSLPDSLVDKFKICTDISLAIKRLGYIPDLTYYQLLYPSEEDLYKLVRFLVERLAELPSGIQFPDVKDVSSIRKLEEDGKTENLKDNMKAADNNHPLEKFNGLSVRVVEEEFSDSEVKDVSFSGSSKDNLTGIATRNILVAEGEAERDAIESEETMDKKDEPIQEVISSCNKLSETKYETEILQNQERVLMLDVNKRTSELRKLEEELELLEAATEMAFDDQHPTEFYLKQLNEQIDVSKRNILELKSQWEAFRKPLEERKRSSEESLYANIPEGQEKLQKLREIELEKQSILSEISRRDVEHSNLLVDLENLPKLPSRTSYIEQIKEITKNSGKQDADIEGILKETRELQLESNSIQERLHRTYAVLDEVVFREAKKTPAGRQAYRRLTSIHECFEQITEKILMLDRVRREVADHEKKITGMASRSLIVDKLQADLDAILKENELLEQKRQE
ncbi:Coiled-coil domain-containing protein 22 [Euphorbia peplus]|nr:Coiled-coil domain-containing protein 22 [Euphorbia peplus]